MESGGGGEFHCGYGEFEYVGEATSGFEPEC